jgi:hypothetical protein
VSINKQDRSVSVCAAAGSYLNDVEKIFGKQVCAVFKQEYWKKSIHAENRLPYVVEIFKDGKE